jgi:hypothetical protein
MIIVIIGGLLIVPLVFYLLFDFKRFITLNGLIKWHQIRGKSRIWLIIAFICFIEIMLGIYLVRVGYDLSPAKARREQQLQEQQLREQQLREQLPHQISALEAQLGILPPTGGPCSACQKQLVLNAEFCQYCGATVTIIERPKVCPKCATTALPDAHWCPKCRTALA